MKSSSAVYLSLFLSFFMVLFSGSSIAQIGNSSKTNSDKYIKSENWSVQAEVIGFNSLSTNLGLSLSIKKNINQNSAFQSGVEFLGLVQNYSNGVRFTGNIPNFYSVQNTDIRSKGTQVFFKYLYYPLERRKVTIYTGGGPLIGYYVDRVERNGLTSSKIETDSYLIKEIGYTWAAGLILNTGLEWYAYDNFSIVAEYGIAIVYSWSKVNVKNINLYSPGESISNYSARSLSVLPAMLKIGCSVSL